MRRGIKFATANLVKGRASFAMAQSAIDIAYRQEQAARQARSSFIFKGLLAERVAVGGAVSYDYNWVGERNYIALHDIDLKDGEISVAGAKPQHVVDLRGRLTFAPKGCPLSGWVSTSARANAFTSITYDADLLERELSDRPLKGARGPRVHFRNASIASTLKKIETALLQPGAGDALYIETLTLAAALEIERVSEGLMPLREAAAYGRLAPALELRLRGYIEEHLAKDLTLDELASTAGLSRFHFSRAFKATFGLPPRDYVQHLRIEKTKALVASGHGSIDDIAASVGFASVERMNAAFRKVTGRSPRELFADVKRRPR